MSRLDQLKKLAELEPDDPMSHYGVGLEYLNLKQWTDAIAAFSRALEADPRYSAAFYHRARAEIAAGQPEQARRTLQDGMACASAARDWHTEGEMRDLLETLA